MQRERAKKPYVLLILLWRSGEGNSIRDSVRSVHQAGDDLQYLGNGNGISHALHIRGRNFGSIDADQFPFHIEQGAAAVAGIDGCVSLDYRP